MKENVGRTDAYLRITAGLTMLVSGAHRRGMTGSLVSMLGAMKVAEGVTRYCPMLDALGLSTVEGVHREQVEQPATGASPEPAGTGAGFGATAQQMEAGADFDEADAHPRTRRLRAQRIRE